MSRSLPIVCMLAVALAASTAIAQPTPEPLANQPTGLSAAQVKVIADQAAADAVAAERARVAAEAKAKEDADAAKAADAAKTAPPATSADDQNLNGADGFTDVRLNFTLTNENLLTKPGETIPSVPGWRFGRPNSLGTLFFDNYDTRFSGYETLSHAIMYRNYKKDHLEVEGGFVVRINEIAERRIDLSDDGSYVLVSWWKDPTHKDPSRVTVTTFPVSSDRFRLGYSYRLSWGGNEEYRRSSQAVPGVKVQIDTDKLYAFLGAKTAVVLDSSTAEQVAKQAVLAGAGVDLSPELRFELNGGYFDRGSNELEDVNTQEVQLYGGSAQIAAHHGMPVQSSIDYKLYKYDPERIGRVFQKAVYPGGLSWLVMAEVTYLGQTLKDPEMSGSTRTQPGIASDINLRVMLDRVRVRVDVQYRDLAFILHSVPSLPTYSDFPTVYDITPNYFAAAGIDKNWDDKLTLGVVVGLDVPASLTSPTGIPGDTTATGKSTAVIRNTGDQTLITVLPTGKSVAPQVAGKLSARYDFGDVYAALVDLYYTYDQNQTRLKRDSADGLFRYEFAEFNQLGVNLTLQAKF